MKPKWTEDQQKVIDLRERNILVSAAAGSGKTAVLVQRIVEKITDATHPVDIDRLLVVTFTRAAASEMRGRIGKALESRLQDEPENENLQRQLGLLHNAQITTIDSFCQYIIRNYFHVIDIDPMFRVGDETDLKLMREKVLGELLEEKYRIGREENDQDFLDMMQIFSTGRTDKAVEELILKLYGIAQSYPMPKRQLQQWAKLYDVDSVQEMEQTEWMQALLQDVRQSVESYVQLAVQALQCCEDVGGPMPYYDTIDADKRALERLKDAATMQELYEGMKSISFGRLAAIRGKSVDTALKDRVKQLRESYKDKGIEKLRDEFFFQSPEEMVADLQEMRRPIIRLLQLTEEFTEAFALKKQEEGVIDFGDMEHFALQILTQEDEQGNIVPTDTAKELQEYYDEILVDEYQDSNYVQEMILTSISRGPEQKPYFFMVGDVKQSIYQFRLARPDLFMDKYHRYTKEESKSQRIDLQKNFRSRANVLEFTNYIFEHVMQEKFGGIAYDEAARLVPGAAFADAQVRVADNTEIVLIEQDSMGGSKGKIEQEALAIGNKIKDMVRGDAPMYVSDNGNYRPVEYHDIVILLRSMKGWAETLQETLMDMGIPAYAPKATGYFSALEVKTVLDFLRVIDNPRQDIPLAAVLRSVLFEVDDEQLAYLGAMAPALHLWDKVVALTQDDQKETTTDLRDKLTHFVDSIKYYQRMSQIKPVYDILRDIYERFDYYSIISAMPGGEQRSGNLDILLQQSIQFAGNGHHGVFGFCHYIEELQKSDIDFGEASLSGEGANAVQIVSIHKSKGLEFPVVFVAGLGKQFNLQDVRKSVLVDMDYGAGVDYVDLDNRIAQPSLIKRVVARKMLKGVLTEEIRVLYVALTRAKEKLILTGVVKNLAKKLSAWELKSASFDEQELFKVRTYLDLIMPPVCKKSWYPQCAEWLQEVSQQEDATQDVYGRWEDDGALFSVEVVLPQHKVEREKEELQEILEQRQRLKDWDVEREYDAELAERFHEQKEYRYPYEKETDLPVKVSVSELKHRAMERLIQEELGYAEAESIVPEEVESAEMESLMPEDHEQKEKGLLASETVPSVEKDSVYAEKNDIPQPAFRRKEQKVSGAQRGTLYHLVMEHIPYQEVDANYDFGLLLERMEQQGFFTAEERQLIYTGSLAKFVFSDLGKRMKDADARGQLRREQQFMMGIAAKELYPETESEETILVQGIIDACFLEEGEWVLVDYKTDYVKQGDEQLLAERYREQLRQYARALEQITGIPVKEQVIYSVGLGKSITL